MRKQPLFNNLRAKGLTPMMFMITLAVIGAIIFTAMNVVPIYMAYYDVRYALQGVRNEPNAATMSAAELRRAIARRFDIGYVSVIRPADVKIERRGNVNYLIVEYEDRRPFLSNLDIVAKFEEEISLAQ